MPEDRNLDLDDENRRLRRAVEELSVLNELAAAISSAMGLDEVIRLIVKKAINAVNVEQGSILLIGEDQGGAPKTLVRGMDTTHDGPTLRIGASLAGWVLKNREPLLSNDLDNDDRFLGLKGHTAGIRSVLCVPLKLQDRIIALLNLLNKKHDGQFTEDDQRLASIIGSQSAQVIENARLYEEEKKREAIEQELKLAQSIQRNLLPSGDPEVSGLDIAGVSLPARETGGDYYDFLELPSGKLGLVIADVSGKGVPAALLMANIQATLRGELWHAERLSECMSRTSDLLYHSTAPDKYATLFCGLIDTSDRVLLYSNGGHNFPLLRKTSGELRELSRGGVPIGLMEDAAYEEDGVALEPGEVLVLYSDGVTEAENAAGEQFDEERLKQALSELAGQGSRAILDGIVARVAEFRGEAEQTDDITIVVVSVP